MGDKTHRATSTITDMEKHDTRARQSHCQRTNQGISDTRKGYPRPTTWTPWLGDLSRRRQLARILFKKRRIPADRSSRQEVNIIEAPTASAAPVFRTKCIVNGHATQAMIDSGASGNFISTSFVQRNGIATRRKKDGGYELMVADGLSLSEVDSETIPLVLAI